MIRPLDDTIAAIATAPGAAGLAVVRVSGGGAMAIADRVFRGRASLAAAPTHTLHHGWAVDAAGARLDEVLAAAFRAPRSYTREDAVELSCHGGEQSARRVLAALVAAGARLAGPGEFTLRAFVHGRLDLAQAEAVADLIHAETAAAADLALSQLAGELSRRIAGIAEGVTDALATVEAHVDFAEDVGGIEVPAHVRESLGGLVTQLDAMLASGAYARAVRGGVPVAIVGRPNAGKSSLFNLLLGESRAIVAPVAGTTRDRVSEPLEIAGVRVMLSDTAGLRDPDGARDAIDAIEAIGIARAVTALEGAALVLWVVDGSECLGDEDHAVAARLRGLERARVIAVLNKSDRPARVHADELVALLPALSILASRRDVAVVSVSALSGAGTSGLRAAMARALGAEAAHGGLAGAVADPRHIEALTRACEALRRAAAAADAGLPGEIVALELRESLAALGEVTGTHIGEDLLERIFNRFCIGK